MYLSVHVPFALAITASVTNPLAALGIGIASHFLLDMVPHDSHADLTGAVRNDPKRKRLFMIETVVDAGIWLSLSTAFFLIINPSQPMVAMFAIAGCIAPDVISGIFIFLKKPGILRYLWPIAWLNMFFHFPLGKYVDPPRWFSLPMQMYTCLFMIFSVIVQYAK